MRNKIKLVLIGIAVVLAFPVNADLVGGNAGLYSTNVAGGSWATISNWFLVYSSLPLPNSASTVQTNPAAGAGTSYVALAETFTPKGSFTLGAVTVVLSTSNPTTVTLALFDLGVWSNSALTNGSSTYTNTGNLFGNGTGLVVTLGQQAALQTTFAFNSNTTTDLVALVAGHTYAFEIWTSAAQAAQLQWYRGGAVATDGQMFTATNTSDSRRTLKSLGLSSVAPQSGSLAVYYAPQPLPAHLRVTNQSPAFVLDTQIGTTSQSLVVSNQSAVFTVDTRIGIASQNLIVSNQSSSFIVDTRIVGVSLSDSNALAQSGAFTIDTRLQNPALQSLIVSNQSAAFTVDTRIGGDLSGSNALVVQMNSGAFTLDTRLTGSPHVNSLITTQLSLSFTVDTRIQPNTNLIAVAGFGPFTVNTLGFYVNAPAQILANTNSGVTGGKLRFSPDGLRLAKTDGNRVLIWNLHSTNDAVAFSGHTGSVATVEFSPMGDQLLTGGSDGTTRWWDSDIRNQRGVTTPSGVGAVQSAYASDGARVVAGKGTNVTIYRVTDMQPVQQLTTVDGSITAVAICPEGLAVAGTSTRAVYVWDVATGILRYKFTDHSQLITACAFFAGGTNAMTAALDGTIRVWNLNTGLEVFRIDQGSPFADAGLSSDGKLIVSCNNGSPGSAYLWNAQAGAILRILTDSTSQASPITGVALSPDNSLLATSHADGQVRLWDTGLAPSPAFTMTPLPPGTYVPVTLRSHGLYYFEVDAQTGSSVVVTLKTNSGGATPDLLKASGGKSSTDSSAGISPDAIFGNLPQVAVKALKAPPSETDITGFCVAGTKGRLPSEYDYDSFAQASLTNLYCEMPMANPSGGKVYVLVFAPYLAAGSIAATIRADYADFHLSSVSPSRGGNSGNVTAKVFGTGITPDTTATLLKGNTSIPGQMALWKDSTKAWFTFALSNAPPGTYNVQLNKQGFVSAVITNAFQVVAGVGPLLQSQVIAPAAVRPSLDYKVTISYANVGDVDMAAPLFFLDANHTSLYPATGLRLADTMLPPAKVSQIQVLGQNFDGPPGILPPGYQGQIPLNFHVGASDQQEIFNLSVLLADSSPIDWTQLESQLRPAGIADDLWAALWSNFKTNIGSTWADYLRALDNESQLLALSGQQSYDVGHLIQLLFSRVASSSNHRTLAAAVDARAPAPVMPLQFSRFNSDSLQHRFAIGALGRGWSHNFEYSLSLPTNGVITVNAPGGVARSFVLGTDSAWHAQVGDYGLLATNASGFTLTEKDGVYSQFNNNGQLVKIGEPNGNQITLTYSNGFLATLAHSAGPTFTLGYNVQGRLSQLTDQASQVTTYQYDFAGEHLLRVISPGNLTNSYTYQPVTNSPPDHALTAVAFPDRTHQHYVWDSRGRLAQQSRDGSAELLQFAYDSNGGVTVQAANNAVTTVRYSSLGQLLQATDPLGRTLTFNYDTNLNIVQQIGPTGDSSQLAYDALGNATNAINPLAQQVSLSYGNFSQMNSMLDARNQPMNFGYDAKGNMTGIAYADSSIESFGYDSAGNATSWQNRRGQTIQFTRNTQGQVSRKTYPNGRTLDYLYDSRGLLTNITDSAQGVTRMSFDVRRFLTGITYPDGNGFTFEYNAAGRRTRRIGNDGYILTYGYDAVGRLQSLSNSLAQMLVQYSYDALGRLSGEVKGNGTFTLYSYDAANQVVAMTNYAPGRAVQSFFNYTYDAKGNRLTMTTAAGVTAYTYDVLNQLTGANYPGGRSVTYAYDAAGNRTVVSDTGNFSTYAANNLNEYTQVGGTTYGYDADGNLTSQTDSSGTTTYQFDFENRLVSATTPTNGVWQYVYDSLGNRSAVIHNGITNRYLLDPSESVDVAAEFDSGGNLIARYDDGLGLVSRTDGAGSATFYAFDGLGNTRLLTGIGGTILNSYDYDVFGATIQANESVANSFRFVGRYGVGDEPIGLHFMHARFYSASVGRFMTPDPISLSGGDVNCYRYAANSPIMLIDPEGLSWNDRYAPWKANGYQRFLNPKNIAKLPLAVLKNPYVEAIRDGYAAGVIIGNSVYDALNPEDEGNWTGPWGGSPGYKNKISEWVGKWTGNKLYDLYPPPEQTPQPPQGQKSPGGNATSQAPVVRSRDPNDKIGPTGIGPNQVVSTNDAMEYMIRFENAPSASAPVQQLDVVDYLDQNLDWTTVIFEEIAYGGRSITPPANSQSFTLIDKPSSNSPAITGAAVADMVVNVSASFNPQIGRLDWRVTAVDTNTGFVPLDALSGILPPDDGTGRGQGYVRFTVKPKSSTTIGTGITNVANIIFDSNESIPTPPVWNIIGDVPPLAAAIAYLPGQITVGTPATYTVALTNTGGTTITNVVLTNALPTGVNIVNATANHGTVTVTNGMIIWNLGTVTNGFRDTLTVTVLPTQGGTFDNNLFYTGGSGLAIYAPSTPLVVIAPVIPILGIRFTGGQVELSWGTNAIGFALETTASLSATSVWSAVTSSPAIFGSQKFVTNSTTAPTRFYRLKAP